MKYTLATLACLCTLMTLSPAWAAMDVVTTIPDLGAVARAVGGERVNVTSLARPTQDPHYVDARPSFILKLNKASVLIHNGLELEVGWLPSLLRRARNSRILVGAPGNFNASSFVSLMQVPTARVDRAMGDLHPGGNPHFMLDPRRARDVARALRDRFSKIDPEGAKVYAEREALFRAALDRRIVSHRKKFLALPAEKRRVVSYHQSLVYLMDWLGLENVITIEPKPGIPPNPKHVGLVLKTMRARGARVILQESYYPQKVSAKLATLSKGSLVVIPGGATDNMTYLERVDTYARKIYGALSK